MLWSRQSFVQILAIPLLASWNSVQVTNCKRGACLPMQSAWLLSPASACNSDILHIGTLGKHQVMALVLLRLQAYQRSGCSSGFLAST